MDDDLEHGVWIGGLTRVTWLYILGVEDQLIQENGPMQKNLRKSIFGAILGLSMAVGFGVGVTQLHASVAASEAADQVCPVETVCPLEAASASSCPMSRGASI